MCQLMSTSSAGARRLSTNGNVWATLDSANGFNCFAFAR